MRIQNEKRPAREEFRVMVTLGGSMAAGSWSTSPNRYWMVALVVLINNFQFTPMVFVNPGIEVNVVSIRSPAYM